jgi:hypothetical protein
LICVVERVSHYAVDYARFVERSTVKHALAGTCQFPNNDVEWDCLAIKS